MTYWPYIVNWILPSSSSSSSSSEYYEDDEDDKSDDKSPNDDIDIVVACDQSPDIDSVVSPSIAPNDPSSSSSKRRRTEENDEVLTRAVSQKKVWNKEDELELLHGFLDYTSKRRKTVVTNNGRNPKNQVSSFFDNHVSPDLKLRFNKNQIVDKLRRLKRKYRNNEAKNDSGSMGFRFKNSHDKATFELCGEIWKSGDTTCRLLTNNGEENSMPNMRSRSTTRAGLKKLTSPSPKEDESSDTMGLGMDLGLSSYAVELMKFGDECDNDDDDDEKEQKIMELEDYLKRLKMVQAKVKASLDKLRSKLD